MQEAQNCWENTELKNRLASPGQSTLRSKPGNLERAKNLYKYMHMHMHMYM